MIHQDYLSEAMKTFLKELPDPQICASSTIQSEVDVKGEHIKFVAQKVKGKTGITWKVYPAERWQIRN